MAAVSVLKQLKLSDICILTDVRKNNILCVKGSINIYMKCLRNSETRATNYLDPSLIKYAKYDNLIKLVKRCLTVKCCCLKMDKKI